MRFVHFLSICFVVLQSLSAQQTEQTRSLFGCSQDAVEIALKKNPPLHFVALDQAPAHISFAQNEHRFVFHGGQPFDTIYIYFTATIGEENVGRGSSAGLGIYAEFTHSESGARSAGDQWWRVEPTVRHSPQQISSESLNFDAEPIRGCFEQEVQCHFADVALATSDPDIAMLAVKFGENLGGANAANWTESSLLLDFRQSPPRVLASADCAYNEGGGACTALDSGEAARSDLRCEWKGEKQDFLCSEESSTGNGHSDSYLLSDEAAPLRSDEVVSVQDAIGEIRAKGNNVSVKVRGIGPVAWIGEIELESRDRIIVLGSAEAFYFVREHAGLLKTPVQVKAHAVIEDAQRDPGAETGNGWTLDHGPTFRSQPIIKGRALTIMQVVSHEYPDLQQLYWIGVDSTGRADAVQLVGGDSYAGCGREMSQASVVSVGKIERPFTAKVRLQPPTMTSADESLTWVASEEDENATDCIRPGEITWKDGKFQGKIDSGACTHPGKPKYVQVDNTGKITLKDSAQH